VKCSNRSPYGIKPPEVYRQAVNIVALFACHCNSTQVMSIFNILRHHNCASTPQANHDFPEFSQFPWPMPNSRTCPGFVGAWPPVSTWMIHTNDKALRNNKNTHSTWTRPQHLPFDYQICEQIQSWFLASLMSKVFKKWAGMFRIRSSVP